MVASKKIKNVSKVGSSKSDKDASKDQLQETVAKLTAQLPSDVQKKMDGLKETLDTFKTKVIERFEDYIMGIALLPPDLPSSIIADFYPPLPGKEDVKPSKDDINVLVLVDDGDSKKMSKMELIDRLSKVIADIGTSIDKNIKPFVIILSELWQSCYDAKYDYLEVISKSAFIFDKGMLAAVKISEIHKQMVLKKFEKYIVSYVLSGSLTQGRATEKSDIDVFVVIDDTDVKKMTRAELKDKLRAIILSMGMEAGQITGIQNKINIQVYILTDFWEYVKDASPVIFTLLRFGVPFYDRGVFMPWKQLLAMGRIKPSPEAIDMFMRTGSQVMERVNFKIKEIVMEDLFWALLTPSQAALMMYGVPPTTPKETPEVMTDILVKKEKILEAKYVKTLETVLKLRKEFEHGDRKTISGSEMDKLVNDSKDYLKRIEDLFKEIDERKEKEGMVHTFEHVLTICRDVLKLEGVKSVDEKTLLTTFNTVLVKPGLAPEKFSRILKEIVKGKQDYDLNKLTKHEVQQVNKASRELTSFLVEYIQRKRGRELEKTRIRVKHGSKFGEVILLEKHAYIIHDIDNEVKSISKANITKEGGLTDVVACTIEELEEALMAVEIPPKVFIKSALFEDLGNIFGKDVEVLMHY